jgi:hypothetical protein
MGVASSGCFFVYGLNDGEKLLRPFLLFFFFSSSGLFVGMVKEVREMGERRAKGIPGPPERGGLHYRCVYVRD